MPKIGLVQIAELGRLHRERQQYYADDGRIVPKIMGSVEPGTAFDYLPLSAGALQAYVERHAADPARFAFLPAVYRRTSVARSVAALADADIVGFSAYVWNCALSLRIAAELKRRNPAVLIVFGGPHVPDDPTGFLEANPQVDVTVHGEGEARFLEVIEHATPARPSGVASVAYRGATGSIERAARGPRMRDLADAPSPYLAGVFGPLVDANPDTRWLVLWETNRGCPFSCAFCDWGSAVAGKVSRFGMARLLAEIDWFVANRVGHVFICDANFGMLERDVEIARALVERYEAAGLQVAISIQNAKNATDRSYRIQQIFSNSKQVHFGATLSLQSVDATVLDSIRRSNISLEAFDDLRRRYQEVGVETYTDLIVGLPRETFDSFADGVSEVIEHGQHNRVSFYNCSILPNAEMGSPDYQARYGIETVSTPLFLEHEALDRAERAEVPEYLDIVVSTADLGRDGWVRTRTFAWLVEALHFNRLAQIVAIAARHFGGMRYRAFYEAILDCDADRYPVCARMVATLRDRARALQRGETQFVPSGDYLNIHWPADQYVIVDLVAHRRIDAFYDELLAMLDAHMRGTGRAEAIPILHDAVLLNRAAFRLPRRIDDLEIEMTCDLPEYWRGVVTGHPVPLRRGAFRYRIDRSSTIWVRFEDWCEDVVMQLYDRTNFLYPIHRDEAPVVPERLLVETAG